jgi:uncharacterized LabA/DUF88 family protein
MKTIVYVDGYNFYFGLLRHSPFKWLDLVKLFNSIIPTHCQEADIVKVKLFTAPTLAKFATQKQKASESQQRYWRALEVLYPEKIEIIKGYYSDTKQNAMLYITPPDKAQRVDVWKLEEKLTDTQMSLHIYRDALKDDVDQVVIVSNDSDMEPAAQMVKEDTTTKLGIILPRIKGSKRTLSQKLINLGDWSNVGITEQQLTDALLPAKVPTKKKPIVKPDYW